MNRRAFLSLVPATVSAVALVKPHAKPEIAAQRFGEEFFSRGMLTPTEVRRFESVELIDMTMLGDSCQRFEARIVKR